MKPKDHRNTSNIAALDNCIIVLEGIAVLVADRHELEAIIVKELNN